MAFLEMHFPSESLKQGVSVNILLPDKTDGGKFKTLWLLHGQSDDHTFQSSEGRHVWKYWDLHLQDALACWQSRQK